MTGDPVNANTGLTKINPDKGTETNYLLWLYCSILFPLTKINPDKGTETSSSPPTTFCFDTLTKINPDKGTETHMPDTYKICDFAYKD